MGQVVLLHSFLASSMCCHLVLMRLPHAVLAQDVEKSADDWQRWAEAEAPESAPMPGGAHALATLAKTHSTLDLLSSSIMRQHLLFCGSYTCRPVGPAVALPAHPGAAGAQARPRAGCTGRPVRGDPGHQVSLAWCRATTALAEWLGWLNLLHTCCCCMSNILLPLCLQVRANRTFLGQGAAGGDLALLPRLLRPVPRLLAQRTN